MAKQQKHIVIDKELDKYILNTVKQTIINHNPNLEHYIKSRNDILWHALKKYVEI